MVTKRQNRKDHSVSASFLIYSIFSNRNQISLLSRKAYYNDWKKVGCPCLLVSYSQFSTDRAQYQGKSAMFSICACVHGGEGEGQGVWISHLWYPVFLISASCIQTYYVAFLNFAHSPSLLVVRSASRPLLSHLCAPALCLLCHFKASTFDYSALRHSQACPVQCRIGHSASVVIHWL